MSESYKLKVIHECLPELRNTLEDLVSAIEDVDGPNRSDDAAKEIMWAVDLAYPGLKSTLERLKAMEGKP